MIAWTARWVIPTRAAMSRMRTRGSLAMRTSTWPWLVKNVQLGLAASSGSLFGRAMCSILARFVKQRSGSQYGLADQASCRQTKKCCRNHEMDLVGILSHFGSEPSTFDGEGQ